MNIKILFLILSCIMLTGCTLTGKVVKTMDSDVQNQLEKDYSKMVDALDKSDSTLCYYVMNQPIREDCFMRLAKKLNDSEVCKNLLQSKRQECLAQLNQ